MTPPLLGFATAFTLSIVPGPLGILIVAESAAGRRIRAGAAALGGTLVDTVVCFLVFAGLGVVLQPVAQSTLVKILAIAGTAAIGALFLLLPARRPGPPPGNASGFFLGVLLSALNAGTLGPWLVSGAAWQSRGMFLPSVPAGALFAAGAALGTLAWFSVLLFAGSSLHRHRELFAACARRAVSVVLFLASGWMAWTLPA